MLRNLAALALLLAVMGGSTNARALSFTLTRITDDSTDAYSGLVDRQLALDRLGRPHVVFGNQRPDAFVGVYHAWKPADWQVQPVAEDSTANQWPSVSPAPDGAVHAALCRWTDMGSILEWSRIDSGSVDPPTPIAPDIGLDRPSIAVDSAGTVHIAFENGGVVGYARRDAGGWSAIDTLAEGRLASLAVEPDGHCHVVFEQWDAEWHMSVQYVHGTLGSWSAPEWLAGVGTNSARNPSIAARAGGRVHVAYEQLTDYDLAIHVRARSGGTWSAPQRVAPGSAPSIAVDALGREYIAYWDFWTPLGLALAMHREVPPWVVVSVDPLASPGTEIVLRPSVAVGTDAGIHVFYQSRDERGGWDIEVWYAHADAATDASWDAGTAPALAVKALPNPAHGGAMLRFTLPAAGPARLDLVDVRGRVVRCLHAGVLPAGSQTLAWDGRDAGGRRAPAGVYLVRLRARGEEASEKLVLRP